MKSAMLRFILLSLIISNSYATGNRNTNEPVVPGVVIVKFRELPSLAKSSSTSAINNLMEKYGMQKFDPVLGEKLGLKKRSSTSTLEDVYFVKYNSPASPQVVAADLTRLTSQVIYAEPQYLHFLSEAPNDSLLAQQYALQNIKAVDAWAVTKGEQGDAVIAIVDGGTEINHPDLNANIWINPGEIPNDNIDNDDNGYTDDVYGWNFANNNGDPTGLPSTPINANHGTHTAGIASAVTDNSIGIAGTAFNAKIMAINVGSRETDNSIAHGYSGILYAARNGADVISCSWGRPGSPSQYEQGVIAEATALGAVVVVAAGNNNSDSNYFPAQYTNAFSVAAVDVNDIKASFSNFGTKVDVSAPGVSVLSTLTSGRYGNNSGTSMACPVAAGVIALVKTKNENWSGVQAAEQVRVTADNIDAENPGYVDELGAGRVNALTALSEQLPSIRISEIEYMDDAGDGIIEPGDIVTVDLQVMNFLKPADNISFELTEEDQFIEILAGNSQLTQLGTLEKAALPTQLKFQVHPDSPTGHVIKLKLNISATGYQDADYFTLVVLPTFANIDVNNVKVTVTNIGRIGYADINLSDTGIGFSYNDGPNLLYEGAIIAGISSGQVSNAARGVDPDSDQDFEVVQDGNLEVETPGSVSAQESKGIFADIYASAPLPVQIQQTTYSSDDPDKDDFIVFKYRIVNTSDVPLKDFYFGLFFDWDLDGENYITNKVEYDPARGLGYVYDTGSGPSTYAGVSLLSDQTVNFRAIFNDESALGNPSWGIYDGFTDEEKFEAISGGTEITSAGPEDISMTISAGPVLIDPHSAHVITFAMLAADDLAALKVHADSAKAFWQSLEPLAIEKEEQDVNSPYSYRLNQNYPNPFNPETVISWRLAVGSQVELSMYNLLGRRWPLWFLRQ